MLFTQEDWNVILFFTARTLAYHSGAFQKLERIYSKNELAFYQLAKQHPLRNCNVMMAMPLTYEIKTSHMLGVILAAEEDEKLKSEVVHQLKILFPNCFEYLRHPNDKNGSNMRMEEIRTQDMKQYSSLYGAYFLNYLYGSAEETVQADSWLRPTYDQQVNILCMRKWSVERELVENGDIGSWDKVLLKIINSWQNIDHFVRFVSAVEECSEDMYWEESLSFVIQHHREIILSYIKDRILPYDLPLYLDYAGNPENNRTVEKIGDVYFTLAHLCRWAGYSLEEVNRAELKKKDRNDLIELSKIHRGEETNSFSIEKYIYNIFIFRLLQEYKKAKEQYFRDNEEQRLLEEKKKQLDVLSLQNQLQDLMQKSERLIKENQALQEENRKLSAISVKIEQETKKAYKQQVSEMKELIKEQQKQLYDLAPLREFIFSLESDESFSESSVPLSDYSKHMRIATLGGHENLRKKITQMHDDFLVLDGTQKSLDFLALFQNIDVLFLFTEHMSHAVYDNAVSAAERYKIKLAYIHVTNLNAIERKMTEEIRLWTKNEKLQ